MSEPKLTQVGLTISAGGKVQIIKYDLDSSYFVSANRTFTIPDDWTQEQAEEFQAEQLDRLRTQIDKRADIEFDERWKQSYLNK